MAIAGSTQEAFFLRLENGELRELGKHRPASHLIKDDVEKALAALRAGKAVYLLVRGDNLSRLRKLVKGVEAVDLHKW